MVPIYTQLRNRAREIVAKFPSPDFYKVFSQVDEQSRHLVETDPIITELRLFVAGQIEDDFGHGLKHAIKVAIDAGTLMFIEGTNAGYSDIFKARSVLLAQCAGILHDIKRKHENHARKGADFAGEILKKYPFLPNEIKDIRIAIRNHEAFKNMETIHTPEGVLVSACLYDADKFRWGPDNFYYTLWDMVSYYKMPFTKFMEQYPKGMEGLVQIKSTFRTQTGKKYGPQFIDIGLAIGQELHEVIRTEFAHLIQS
jgi:hypothetical protein